MANPSPIQMRSEVHGDGQPLALVGGGLTGWSSWRPLLPRLGGRSVLLLQPVNVQYGLEGRTLPPRYSVRMEADALGSALDARGIRAPVDLMAWSYGAEAALAFALDHPERIRSAILIEPPALWTLPDHGRGFAEVARLEKLIRSPTDEIDEATLEAFLHISGIVPPEEDARKSPQWTAWIGYRNSLRNTPALFSHEGDLAGAMRFDRPVLLATGTGTSPFLRRVVDTLALALPRARVVELPAGHAPHLVSPDRFFAKVAEFLRQAEGATPGPWRGGAPPSAPSWA